MQAALLLLKALGICANFLSKMSPGLAVFALCAEENHMRTNKKIAPPFKFLRYKAVYAALYISV